MLYPLLFCHSGLLAENNRLSEEAREVQRQHEREHEKQSARIRQLEQMIEESELDFTERPEKKKTEADDLEKQIEVNQICANSIVKRCRLSIGP